MRENMLKRMIAEGKTAVGAYILFVDPQIVEFMGVAGFDYYFVDGEHCLMSFETICSLVRAANAASIEPVVRVPVNEPSIILRYLETGAWNVVVPHCNTGDDVRRAMSAAKYPPMGIRGANSMSRPARYGLTQTPAEYFAQANKETMIIPLIEEAAAVDNIDEILSVEGLEAIFIGAGDLALTMGYPGQMSHPAVREKADLVMRKAVERGVAVLASGRTPEDARRAVEQGAKMILGYPGLMMASACKDYLEAVRRP